MKILVCMKQVPQKDAPLKLNEAGTWIREDVSYEVNEPDAYALEEALRQKEKHSGEVVVITAGPQRAQQVLREALAKGADRSIHLEDPGFVGLDAFNTAKAFAARIQKVATSDTERVQRAFTLAYGRPASPEEERLFTAFLAGTDAEPTANRLTRWERVAQILIGSNEFMYVD